MPKRKPFDEQGGCLQKAKRARELAQAEVAADGALADVVVVKKRRKRMLQKEMQELWLLHIVDLQHWTVKQHGIGFKSGVGAR